MSTQPKAKFRSFPAASAALQGRIARRRIRISLAVAAILVFAAPPTQAQDQSYDWSVLSGDWSVASNWGGTLPTSTDYAYVINGGTVTITLPGTVCNYLYVGDPNSTNSGTVELSGGSLAASYEYLGNNGAGNFTQSGGANTVTDYCNHGLFLAYNAGSSGSYNLSGSGLLSASNEYVGYSGAGTFTQSGGTNNTIPVSGGLYLGYNPGSSGSYNLSGSGLLSGYSEYVGYSGTGTFTQSGGTNSGGGVFTSATTRVPAAATTSAAQGCSQRYSASAWATPAAARLPSRAGRTMPSARALPRLQPGFQRQLQPQRIGSALGLR